MLVCKSWCAKHWLGECGVSYFTTTESIDQRHYLLKGHEICKHFTLHWLCWLFWREAFCAEVFCILWLRATADPLFQLTWKQNEWCRLSHFNTSFIGLFKFIHRHKLCFIEMFSRFCFFFSPLKKRNSKTGALIAYRCASRGFRILRDLHLRSQNQFRKACCCLFVRCLRTESKEHIQKRQDQTWICVLEAGTCFLDTYHSSGFLWRNENEFTQKSKISRVSAPSAQASYLCNFAWSTQISAFSASKVLFNRFGNARSPRQFFLMLCFPPGQWKRNFSSISAFLRCDLLLAVARRHYAMNVHWINSTGIDKFTVDCFGSEHTVTFPLDLIHSEAHSRQMYDQWSIHVISRFAFCSPRVVWSITVPIQEERDLKLEATPTCGCPAGTSPKKICRILQQRFVWNILVFLKRSLHQRVRKCLATPILEVIKQGENWTVPNHERDTAKKMMHSLSPSRQWDRDPHSRLQSGDFTAALLISFCLWMRLVWCQPWNQILEKHEAHELLVVLTFARCCFARKEIKPGCCILWKPHCRWFKLTFQNNTRILLHDWGKITNHVRPWKLAGDFFRTANPDICSAVAMNKFPFHFSLSLSLSLSLLEYWIDWNSFFFWLPQCISSLHCHCGFKAYVYMLDVCLGSYNSYPWFPWWIAVPEVLLLFLIDTRLPGLWLVLQW